MPTFEGNPISLVFACLFSGIAIGIVVYVAGGAVRTGRGRTRSASAAHRRSRRENAARATGLLRAGLRMSSVLVPIARWRVLDSIQSNLAERYAAAGWPGDLEDDEVLALALLIGVVFCLPIVLLFYLLEPVLAPAGALMIVAGPGLVSSRLAQQGEMRRQDVQRTMPYVMDMLVLVMRAGASFPMAVERVTQDFRGSTLGDEFQALLADLERGSTMRESLTGLSQRLSIPVVQKFTDDLILAEELGRPVAESLERLSDRVRDERVQDAVETAGRTKVLVLVPGMLVFIAVLLLLFAPFIVRYYYGGFAGL